MAAPRWKAYQVVAAPFPCCGGIDAWVGGGLNDKCCTSMIVAATIAMPAIENTPARQCLR
jgi:hypothetical protein